MTTIGTRTLGGWDQIVEQLPRSPARLCIGVLEAQNLELAATLEGSRNQLITDFQHFCHCSYSFPLSFFSFVDTW
jgi:hypothetical protein